MPATDPGRYLPLVSEKNKQSRDAGRLGETRAYSGLARRLRGGLLVVL